MPDRPTIPRPIRRSFDAKKPTVDLLTFVSLDVSDFFVVALKIFLSSGTKLLDRTLSQYIKGQTASAINMRAVPSFSIFQEISEFAMGGLELCPNA
jgi:hypothetical protein